MTTRIVAIRHGKPLEEGFADEILRTLSDEGRSTQRSITEELKNLGIVPDALYSSPLIRAKQTAEVVDEVYGGVGITECAGLGYEFDYEEILGLIPPAEENKTVFFVGHAPTLAEFVNDLVGERVLPLGLSKSGAAVVDFPGEVSLGKGQFFGYFKP